MISSLGRGGKVRKESGIDKRRKRKVLQESNVEMCLCVYWEMGAHGEEGSGVFLLRSVMLGARSVHRARWETGALALSSMGKVLESRAETGLRVVGEEMSLRVVICLL